MSNLTKFGSNLVFFLKPHRIIVIWKLRNKSIFLSWECCTSFWFNEPKIFGKSRLDLHCLAWLEVGGRGNKYLKFLEQKEIFQHNNVWLLLGNIINILLSISMIFVRTFVNTINTPHNDHTTYFNTISIWHLKTEIRKSIMVDFFLLLNYRN